ncbi:MAG TPA: nitrilase-related carbon-nitrogen hydrolase [Candidatus Binatia bacterium]|nr:nitrilase-related carbon-nitrogen hydrolase [Candidatus Binatia bacterium]
MQTPAAHEESQAKEAAPVANQLVTAKPGSWIWLTIAAVLLLFANGVNTIPVAAWVAPVFLLRFVRKPSLRIGLPVAYLLVMAAFAFQFRGMVPIPGIAYYVFLVVWAIPLVVPYVIDRLVAHRLSGLMASLVFPTAWAATEYVVSRGLYGSWGSVAYSQYGNLPLLQLLSVTGLWGITFLIGWFAAVCNWLWEEGLSSKPARRGAWLGAGTIAGVMLLGGARLALFPPSSQTVRVASISKRKIEPSPNDAALQRAFGGRATREDIDAIRGWASAMDDDLLSRAEREMQAGAKIVFWGETNAPVLKQDEAAFVIRGGKLATKYHAYLGMALGVLNAGNTPPLENKLVFVQPNGQVAWEYNKARPVPGPEAALQVRGDGKLRALDTPYGRVSSIVCFDGDFPQLLAQAGALGADVMLDPSNDWRAIDPWHTQMASLRAIEQGFNLVRQTSQGLSAAFDYQGRRLAAMDHYQTTDHAMVSQVPTRGVRTVYSRLGDWFAWMCMAVLVLLTLQSLRRKRPDSAVLGTLTHC